MPQKADLDKAGENFPELLNLAARLPGVRINRASYLRGALKRYCTEEQIEQAIAVSPASAGVTLKIINEAANTSIKYETARVAGIAALAGMPGGLAIAVAIPVDMAQNLGHMLRISQKLAYIYGWPDLFGDDNEELDEMTEGVLTLFIGVMFGVQVAQAGVGKVADLIAANVAKKLPKKALMKGTIYPIVKRVAKILGVRMTREVFAKGAAKVIPVVGAALNGGLTFSTFLPMSKKLQKHLASLELTKPDHRQNADTAFNIEID